MFQPFYFPCPSVGRISSVVYKQPVYFVGVSIVYLNKTWQMKSYRHLMRTRLTYSCINFTFSSTQGKGCVHKSISTVSARENKKKRAICLVVTDTEYWTTNKPTKQRKELVVLYRFFSYFFSFLLKTFWPSSFHEIRSGQSIPTKLGIYQQQINTTKETNSSGCGHLETIFMSPKSCGSYQLVVSATRLIWSMARSGFPGNAFHPSSPVS